MTFLFMKAILRNKSTFDKKATAQTDMRGKILLLQRRALSFKKTSQRNIILLRGNLCRGDSPVKATAAVGQDIPVERSVPAHITVATVKEVALRPGGTWGY
jgi:hypothetical protein